MLGTGNNTLTIVSTSSGNTTSRPVPQQRRRDNTIVNVETSAARRRSRPAPANDTINVASNQHARRPSSVQLGGLLTIDTGGGNDTVTVDDSGASGSATTTLTGSTITGLGAADVAEEQTIVVQAGSGTYTLLLPGARSARCSSTTSSTTR